MVIGPPIACCLERKVVTSACSADGGNGAIYELLGMIVSGARQVGGPAGGFGDVLLQCRRGAAEAFKSLCNIQRILVQYLGEYLR